MIFTCPIYWTNIKKTKKSTTHLIGMNFFRNAHYHVKNQMKKDIEEFLKNSNVTPGVIEGKYVVTYTLYYKNPSCDPSNIVALIEKFFLDYAQTEGIISNDNVNFHLGTTWKVAGRDKDNPRCEITIKGAQ